MQFGAGSTCRQSFLFSNPCSSMTATQQFAAAGSGAGRTYAFGQLYMLVGLFAHQPLQQHNEMLLLQPVLAGQADGCWAS